MLANFDPPAVALASLRFGESQMANPAAMPACADLTRGSYRPILDHSGSLVNSYPGLYTILSCVPNSFDGTDDAA
jgi:hypothetical protein